MRLVAWIAIGSPFGATFAALCRPSPPGGRVLVVIVAALGGAVGGLLGTAASSASTATFFAVAPWATAVLAGVGLHNVVTEDAGSQVARAHAANLVRALLGLALAGVLAISLVVAVPSFR